MTLPGLSNSGLYMLQPDPEQEIYCGDEGWGPWWIPRARGHTRSEAKTEIASLVGERYVDLQVHAKRGRTEWLDSTGWWFYLDPNGAMRVWEVAQR